MKDEKRKPGRPRQLPRGPLVWKTWRIPKGLDTQLRARAKKNGVALNALVVSILAVHMKGAEGGSDG